MKKVIVAVLVVVLLVSVLIAGCQGGVSIVRGSGNLETETYNLSDFTRVSVSNAFEVEIAQSGSYSVSITADDNLFEYIVVSQAGQTLQIGLKTIVWPATLKAKITMPQLSRLDLSGATRGTVSGFSSTDNLDITVSGASSVELSEIMAGDVKFIISGASKATGDITAGDVDFKVDGASTVQLEGSAGDIVAAASGASRVKLAGFTVNDADVTLSGASSGTVNLDGSLDAELSGASKLSYIGEPVMGIINTAGASTLSKK